MSGATCASEEGFPTIQSRAERREQRIIGRITDRVVQAAYTGRTQYEVRSGRAGIFTTTHEPEVYAEVAAKLQEHEPPIEIEAVRLTGKRHISTSSFESPTMLLGSEVTYQHDVVFIQSIGGTALEGEPYSGYETQTRLYPSEVDLDGQHNLSITG